MIKKTITVKPVAGVQASITETLDAAYLDSYVQKVANQLGDTQRTGVGIVFALWEGIREFVAVGKDLPPFVEIILWVSVPEMLNSITDDEVVRADGMELYNKANSDTS